MENVGGFTGTFFYRIFFYRPVGRSVGLSVGRFVGALLFWHFFLHEIFLTKKYVIPRRVFWPLFLQGILFLEQSKLCRKRIRFLWTQRRPNLTHSVIWRPHAPKLVRKKIPCKKNPGKFEIPGFGGPGTPKPYAQYISGTQRRPNLTHSVIWRPDAPKLVRKKNPCKKKSQKIRNTKVWGPPDCFCVKKKSA